MAHTFLVFDFGTNEEAAQQARHRIEGWKQAFRLGKKLELRFERQEAKKPEGKKAEEDGSETIRLFVRLDFSDHEKLSHQRWVDRIPAEEPFKSVKAEVVRHGEGAFVKTAELFDSLT
jgi:hypothetical protein